MDDRKVNTTSGLALAVALSGYLFALPSLIGLLFWAGWLGR